jgi:hypothetical protein
MASTTITREPLTRAEPPRLDCDCHSCVTARETGGWEVWLNGAIVCPACGSAIVPHFQRKHQDWHLTQGTLTAEMAAAWRA